MCDVHRQLDTDTLRVRDGQAGEKALRAGLCSLWYACCDAEHAHVCCALRCGAAPQDVGIEREQARR
jgi:hypothetical protein